MVIVDSSGFVFFFIFSFNSFFGFGYLFLSIGVLFSNLVVKFVFNVWVCFFIFYSSLDDIEVDVLGLVVLGIFVVVKVMIRILFSYLVGF